MTIKILFRNQTYKVIHNVDRIKDGMEPSSIRVFMIFADDVFEYTDIDNVSVEPDRGEE